MEKNALIYVAGHNGLAGSALCRALRRKGYRRILARTHTELDLCDQAATHAFFDGQRPDVVILAAAKVGGIYANDTYPAEFIRENIQIETNVITAAHQCGVKKFLFLGSSCVYPKNSPQPLKESCLLEGPPEPTNAAYALAKLAGIAMCQAFRKQYGMDCIIAIPAALYGPGDNYHQENSHVIPALIRRFHDATQSGAAFVTIWGSGTPLREFLYVDDMADACVFLLENYSDAQPVNIGGTEETSILELAQRVARVVGYTGEIRTDPSRPDGIPRKLLAADRLSALGWRPSTRLDDGLHMAYEDFRHTRGARGE